MPETAKIRSVVARFFQVPESEVTDAYAFPRQRLNGSLARSTFHAALKRIAGADLPGAFTANSFGELLGGGVAVAPPVASAQASAGISPSTPLGAGDPGYSRKAGMFQTGIDLASLEELPPEGSAALAAFVAETFSADEQAYARAQREPRLTLLGLWAAKEAVMKCGHTSLAPKNIQITHDPRGQPQVTLPVSAASSRSSYSVSISHTGTFAIAICLRSDV